MTLHGFWSSSTFSSIHFNQRHSHPSFRISSALVSFLTLLDPFFGVYPMILFLPFYHSSFSWHFYYHLSLEYILFIAVFVVFYTYIEYPLIVHITHDSSLLSKFNIRLFVLLSALESSFQRHLVVLLGDDLYFTSVPHNWVNNCLTDSHFSF